MANGNNLVEVPIQPGMREDVDPALLPPGVPRYLENTRCYQQGRIEKRPGTLPYVATGLPTAGAASWLATQGGRVVLGAEASRLSVTGPVVYEQEGDGDLSSWSEVGAHSAIVPERRFSLPSVGFALSGIESPTCAVVGDLIFAAYTEDTGVGLGTTTRLFCATRDGRTLRTRAFANCSKARLLYISATDTLYIVYCDAASTGGDDIAVAVVNRDTLAVGTPTTIDTSGGADFDVYALSSGDWLIALQQTTAVRVRRMSGTTSAATASIGTGSQPSCIGIAGVVGGTTLVGYKVGTNIVVALLGTTSMTFGTSFTFATEGASESFRTQVSFVQVAATEWAVAFGGTELSSAPILTTSFTYHGRVTTSASITLAARKVRHFLPASKLFATGVDGSTGRQIYIWALSNTNRGGDLADPAFHVLELDQSGTSGSPNAFLAAATWDLHLAARPFDSSVDQHQPAVVPFDDGSFATVLQWSDLPKQSRYHGVDAVVFSAKPRDDSVTTSHRFASDVGGALLVSGGCLYEHTGGRRPDLPGYIVENGFPYVPRLASQLAAGGGLTSSTLYSYCAVYAWSDPLGRIHRSAPSSIVTATPSGGNLAVQLRAQSLLVTGRSHCGATDVVIEFYRSWSGGPFYYVGSAAAGINTGSNTVAYTDTAPDSTVTANRPLYTDLGVLPTYPPSGARLFCLGANRAFAVGWAEKVVQCSKLLLPTAPIEFCDDDAFRIFLPERIVALAWLDGALVVFCERGIYLVTGDGPDDQGNGAYAEPRRLPASVSCEDARSVVEVPQGLLFRGGGSIWLLPRGFGPPIPVGDPVCKHLESYLLTSAALVAYDLGAEGRMRTANFVLRDNDHAGAGASRVLVYDLEKGTWSVDSLGCRIGAATACDGAFVWALDTWDAATDHPVRALNVGQSRDYDDDGASQWITMRATFGDLRPFGVLGWGKVTRVQLIGAAVGACKLQLSASVNGNAQTTVEQSASGARDPWYLEHAFEHATVNALTLELNDAPPSGGSLTPGAALRALAFETLPEPGARRSLNPGAERFAP